MILVPATSSSNQAAEKEADNADKITKDNSAKAASEVQKKTKTFRQEVQTRWHDLAVVCLPGRSPVSCTTGLGSNSPGRVDIVYSGEETETNENPSELGGPTRPSAAPDNGGRD